MDVCTNIINYSLFVSAGNERYSLKDFLFLFRGFSHGGTISFIEFCVVIYRKFSTRIPLVIWKVTVWTPTANAVNGRVKLWNITKNGWLVGGGGRAPPRGLDFCGILINIKIQISTYAPNSFLIAFSRMRFTNYSFDLEWLAPNFPHPRACHSNGDHILQTMKAKGSWISAWIWAARQSLKQHW